MTAPCVIHQTGIPRSAVCPFYGRHLAFSAVSPFPVLVKEGGNQCALITYAYAPCRMEADRQPSDWEACPRNPGVNGTGPADLGPWEAA